MKQTVKTVAVILAAITVSAQVENQHSPSLAPKTRAARRLSSQINALLAEAEMAASSVSILIQHRDSGETIYARDAERLLVPASNLKLYTTAVALELLGRNYKIRTSVLARSLPDRNGKLEGDIVLYGRGDPSFKSRFNSIDGLSSLVDQLRNKGIKRIEGNIIADESYFKGTSLGYGWEWLDIQWPYGSQLSALSILDNSFEVHIRPTQVGELAEVTVSPDVGYVTVKNLCRTTAARGKRDIGLHRGLENNKLLVWGSIPKDDAGFACPVSIYQPARLAAILFKSALEKAGISISGNIKLADSSLLSEALPTNPSEMLELAYVESPPLTELVRIINKFSNNLYAELLLRVLGRELGNPSIDSDQAGIEVLKDWLSRKQLDGRVVFYDGSGLSRRSLTNASSIVSLLRYVAKSQIAADFEKSLPVIGLDGTLANRKNVALQQRVRAKTGTLANVSALSGYITTAHGDELVFSILINNHPGGQQKMREFQDKVISLLSSSHQSLKLNR
ncbi:MAG: D-alanyl-D-alanine carboxypeptidase/D-alanyl-D-alanine-endopeptidase [Acidobacteriota bacterium]|nr:D-alanyl-D-alanine carboxypeptidase/D-alanyl-D-alanine-endopeptidase [Blastocatellia bacterium]MDW8413182.1 D-alanyl-D-alanine carboxypeptidase/D-alanyl-D-alanine-endopeptidase [Acidobacteriota bacterium]